MTDLKLDIKYIEKNPFKFASESSVENLAKAVTYFHNSDYENTNMLETLFCAKRKINDEVIVVYGDIIFEEKILRKLIDSEDDFSVIMIFKNQSII